MFGRIVIPLSRRAFHAQKSARVVTTVSEISIAVESYISFFQELPYATGGCFLFFGSCIFIHAIYTERVAFPLRAECPATQANERTEPK